MIDTENEVYSTVATALRAGVSSIYVASKSEAVPASKPAAIGREKDNAVYEKTLDSSHTENHASVMWQWDVYSNLSSGRKEQCKEMRAIIDEQMFAMGFIRVGSSVEIETRDYYLMITRYRGIIGANNYVYRS